MTRTAALAAACFALTVQLCVAETEVGFFLDGRNNFFVGGFPASVTDTFNHANSTSIRPLFSPSGGGGVSVDLYLNATLGLGIFLSGELQTGAVAAHNPDGSMVGASALDEITINSGFRILQRFRMGTGFFFLSEGLVLGLVPGTISISYLSGGSVTHTAERTTLRSLFLIGGEIRAGFKLPLGGGFFHTALRLDLLRIPTGLSEDFSHAVTISPGLEAGYAFRIKTE